MHLELNEQIVFQRFNNLSFNSILLLFVFLSMATMAEIRRGELCRNGEFLLKAEDRILLGHVIATLNVTEIVDCLLNCNENTRCQSVNYEEGLNGYDYHRWELNNLDKETSGPESFIERRGFLYYELLGNLKDAIDCSTSPCLNGGSCVGGCGDKKTFCKCAGPYGGTFCEHFYPKSCKDVLTSNLNKGDGEYDLYLIWPSCNRTARVYCADMGTSTPVEYVTLPAGDAKNFAVYFNSNKGNRREQTNFEKVRLQLPEMKVQRGDFRFASSTFTDAFHSFASAGDCFSRSCDGRNRRGELSVDITGTSFRLPASIPYRFYSYPSCTAKVFDPLMSTDHQRWSGKCGGFCGSCSPKELLLEINGC